MEFNADTGAKNRETLTPEDKMALARVYNTPQGQRLLTDYATEATRTQKMLGSNEPPSFNVYGMSGPGSPLAENGFGLDEENNSKFSAFSVTGWNTRELNKYSLDSNDGKLDNNEGEPLTTNYNEMRELNERMKVFNDLLEGGAKPLIALAASNNYIASAPLQHSSYVIDQTVESLNKKASSSIPSNENDREQLYSSSMKNIKAEDIASELNKNFGTSDADNAYSRGEVQSFNTPKLSRNDSDLQPGMLRDSFTNVKDHPQNGILDGNLVAPGIVQTYTNPAPGSDDTPVPNGIYPINSDKRLLDFVNAELGRNFEGKVAAKFDDSADAGATFNRRIVFYPVK